MSKYLKKFDFYNIDKLLQDSKMLAYLKQFKTIQQKYDHTCGPCCALMVLHYFKDKRFALTDEIKIADIMGTKPFPIGTDLPNIVNFFKNNINEEKIYKVISSIEYPKDKDGLCFSSFDDFKTFVISKLKNNTPIIVENVDYGGHYKVIIGYDCVNDNSEEDMLIFADPSDFNDGDRDGYTVFPAERFFYMWFDDHCLSPQYRKQPFVAIEKIEKDEEIEN